MWVYDLSACFILQAEHLAISMFIIPKDKFLARHLNIKRDLDVSKSLTFEVPECCTWLFEQKQQKTKNTDEKKSED